MKKLSVVLRNFANPFRNEFYAILFFKFNYFLTDVFTVYVIKLVHFEWEIYGCLL